MRPSSHFDFDDWRQLAQSDPDEFERRRRQAVEELIAAAPERVRERLRGLQWRIDVERSRCRTPLAACIRLNAMMWDFVCAEEGLSGALNMLGGLREKEGPATATDTTVVPFPRRRD